MTERSPIAAVILAAGLGLSGWFIGHGLLAARSGDRFVTVRGLAEKDITANVGGWTIRHMAVGPTLAAAQSSIARDTDTIRAFLAEQGFPATAITIADVRVEDRAAWGDQRFGQSDTRFNINQTLEVRTDKVEALRKAIAAKTELVRRGVVLQTGDNDARFTYTALNAEKPAMIGAATRNARAAAEQFATDSKSRIGGIRRATQGYFEILPRSGDYGSAERAPEQRLRVVTTVDFYIQD